jgi:hypothetical protein
MRYGLLECGMEAEVVFQRRVFVRLILVYQSSCIVEFKCTVQESLLVLVSREYDVGSTSLICWSSLACPVMYWSISCTSRLCVSAIMQSSSLLVFGINSFTLLRVFITLVGSYTWTAIEWSIESGK